MKINEKRELVGYEAIEGGDVVLVPATMLPLGAEPVDEDDAAKDRELARLIEEGYEEGDARRLLGYRPEKT